MSAVVFNPSLATLPTAVMSRDDELVCIAWREAKGAEKERIYASASPAAKAYINSEKLLRAKLGDNFEYRTSVDDATETRE